MLRDSADSTTTLKPGDEARAPAAVAERLRPPSLRPAPGRLRPRALLIGLLLIPPNAYWAADQGVDVILSLMVPPIASLLLLCVLNFGLRRIRARWAFSEAELVVI